MNSIVVAGLVTMGLLVGSVASAQSIGASPGVIDVQNILPNTIVHKDVSVSRNNASYPATITALKKTNTTNAITFPEHVVVPAGTKLIKIPITINTTNVAVGAYEEEIVFENRNSLQENKDAVDVIPSVRVKVKFSVSNMSVHSWAFDQALMKTHYNDRENIQGVLLFRNTGNIAMQIRRVNLLIGNKTYLLDDTASVIEPFSELEKTITSSLKISVGEHQGVVDVEDDEGAHKQQAIELSVTSTTSLGYLYELGIAWFNRSIYTQIIGILVLGIILLVGRYTYAQLVKKW